MRKTLFTGACAALILGTAACQDQVAGPASEPVGQLGTLQSVADPSVGRASLDLPDGARIGDEALVAIADRAINPTDYQCPASTAVVDYLIGELGNIFNEDPAAYSTLFFNLAADQVAIYEALFFQTEATPQFIGYNGEYTRRMLKTQKDVKRFWDIFSDDIQLIGIHGTSLLDEQRMAAIYDAAFILPPGLDGAFFAAILRQTMLGLESVNGGNHPIFSFNAVAATGFGPDKILMGDGVLASYGALGFDDVAPQAIYAHEFAHHIQFENGYRGDPVPSLNPPATAAEATRYSELMADAMGAYYLTHARGGTLRQERVKKFMQVFFDLGDCSFLSSGHHGTPNQRMAAAQFGFDVADQAQKQGHILSSEEFHDLFVANYLNLIAPDAP